MIVTELYAPTEEVRCEPITRRIADRQFARASISTRSFAYLFELERWVVFTQI